MREIRGILTERTCSKSPTLKNRLVSHSAYWERLGQIPNHLPDKLVWTEGGTSDMSLSKGRKNARATRSRKLWRAMIVYVLKNFGSWRRRYFIWTISYIDNNLIYIKTILFFQIWFSEFQWRNVNQYLKLFQWMEF